MTLIPWFIAAIGVFGVLIGSFLNVVIWRVPRGESISDPSHCPACGRGISAWQNIPIVSWLILRGRCAGCATQISVRYPLIEGATGASFAGVAWWLSSGLQGGVGIDPTFDELPGPAWWATLGAYLWFTAAGIALIVIDIEHRRLPNAIVGPAFFVVTGLLSAAALLHEDGPQWATLMSVIGGALALFLFYLVIIFITPRGIGAGDVKLAPVTGAALGFFGWGAVIVGAFAAFALGALFGLAIIIWGRGGRKTAVPFGPWMIAGAWIGLIFGQPIAHGYLELFGLTA